MAAWLGLQQPRRAVSYTTAQRRQDAAGKIVIRRTIPWSRTPFLLRRCDAHDGTRSHVGANQSGFPRRF
jgi:hypothetical protein